MTDLTALTEITAPTTDDLVYVVDAPTGAKNPRKCSIANFHAVNDARTKTLTNTTIDAEGTGNSITNIVNANIKSSAGIVLSKLAVDPLARANHTGTQVHTTISDFDTGVQANRLDQMTAPTGAVALNSQKITGLANGVASTDAATKGQVDAAQAGLDAKDACRVATTANITLSGEQTIDGVTTTTDRVLVKNQSTASQNGIYVSASGAWARSTDADANAEVTSGLYTFITEGTANGSTGFVLTTDDPITVGTTALTFSQFSGLAQLVGGTGITKTGNTINVDASQTQITSIGTITTGTWEATDVAVAHGGTGSSTASAARTALGVAIGSDVQAYNSATALTTNKISDFAASTSAELAGKISDETGTGALVFGTSPALTTPTATQLDILAEGNLRLQDATGGQFVAVEAPATVGTSYTVKLPAAIGSAGDALKVTSVAGAVQTMEWDSAGGGAEATPILQAVGYSAANQSPATEGSSAVSIFAKTIDSNNQGLYVRLKKNGGYQDVQIA
jgi:hypothetical protein